MAIGDVLLGDVLLWNCIRKGGSPGDGCHYIYCNAPFPIHVNGSRVAYLVSFRGSVIRGQCLAAPCHTGITGLY